MNAHPPLKAYCILVIYRLKEGHKAHFSHKNGGIKLLIGSAVANKMFNFEQNLHSQSH